MQSIKTNGQTDNGQILLSFINIKGKNEKQFSDP